MRRRWLGLWALIAAAAAASLPACEDTAPVQRGLGSRQLVTLRDPTFSFYATKGDLVIYRTGVDEFGNGVPTWWSIDLGTDEVRDLGSTMPDLTDPQPTPRFQCDHQTDQQGLTGILTITDTQSGAKTTIDRVVTTFPYCPSNADPTIMVWRKEADDTKTLWTGRYDDLQQAPLTVTVHQVMWRVDGTTLVTAASPAAPDEVGVFAIDNLDPSLATEIVPGALATAEWAAGALPSTELVSSSLTVPSYLLPAKEKRYCYERAMSDGSTVMFIGPYAAPAPVRERALFPVAPADMLRVLNLEPYNYRYDGLWGITAAWSSIEEATSGVLLRVWRDESQRLATCPWPVDQYPRALGDPVADNVLFLRQQSSGAGDVSPSSGLLLVVPTAADGNACKMLATEHVGFADFSPDATAMVWLVEPSYVDKATLWTAARDGSAPRVIGTGYITGATSGLGLTPHFVGDSQLELTLDHDLVWLDVHDDPVRMHYITERQFGAPIDLGRWVVTGHDHSEQDANGALALINRDSGETRPISPAVYSYTTPDLPVYGTTPGVYRDDGMPVRIVYLVRGRNPSAQDGVWVATITMQDRQ